MSSDPGSLTTADDQRHVAVGNSVSARNLGSLDLECGKQANVAHVLIRQFVLAIKTTMLKSPDYLQMLRVAARWVVTLVVDLSPIRDRAIRLFIHPPVQKDRLAGVSDFAVTTFGLPAERIPATTNRINFVTRRCFQVVAKHELGPFTPYPSDASGTVRSYPCLFPATTLTQTNRTITHMPKYTTSGGNHGDY